MTLAFHESSIASNQSYLDIFPLDELPTPELVQNDLDDAIAHVRAWIPRHAGAGKVDQCFEREEFDFGLKQLSSNCVMRRDPG